MKATSKILIINIFLFLTIAVCCKMMVFAANNFSYKKSYPSNNSKNVAPDLSVIEMTFPYDIEWNNSASSANIVLKDKKNNEIETEGRINGSGLFIDLKDSLSSNTYYTLTIPAGTLKAIDKGNKDYINSPIYLYFTTKDISFSYKSSTPGYKATGVSDTLHYVSFYFTDAISVANETLYNSITVKDSLNNIISESVDISGNYLNIKMGKLKPYTTYTVFIPEGALKCLDDDETYLYNSEINMWFTTKDDSEYLNILSPQSSDRYKIIDPNATINIKFNKKIKLKDSSKITLTDKSKVQIGISLSIANSGDELIIKPKKSLTNKTSYYINISRTAITDYNSNYLRSDYSYSFSTGTDNDQPKLAFASINDGDMDIPIGTNEIELNFNKNIKYSKKYSDIKLEGGSKSIILTKKINDDKLYINYSALLEEGTSYVLTIPAGSIKDYNENETDEDIVITFTTKYQTEPPKPVLEIQKYEQIEQIEVDAGTPFEDLTELILPKMVTVNLPNKQTANLDVRWYESSPAYNENKTGVYTIKGKFIITDWIVNTKKIIPAVKIKVIDRQNPTWSDNQRISYDSRTETSVRLLWTEADDDSSIENYMIEIKTDGVTKKNIKVPVEKATRLSSDTSDKNYKILFYNVTGLQHSTYYDAYITAYDSAGNQTDALQINFRTYSKTTTTTKSNSSSKNTNNKSSNSKTTTKSYFDDIGNYSWAKKSIENLAEKGIIKGTSKGKFSPGNSITRADLVVILVRALDLDANFSDNFEDVSSSEYYYKSIGIAKELGIVQGDFSGRFMPTANIKREDIFVIIKRALDVSGIELESEDNDASELKDYNIVSDYAIDAVDYLVDAGVVNGEGGYLYPKRQATRAEIAVLISSILN